MSRSQERRLPELPEVKPLTPLEFTAAIAQMRESLPDGLTLASGDRFGWKCERCGAGWSMRTPLEAQGLASDVRLLLMTADGHSCD